MGPAQLFSEEIDIRLTAKGSSLIGHPFHLEPCSALVNDLSLCFCLWIFIHSSHDGLLQNKRSLCVFLTVHSLIAKFETSKELRGTMTVFFFYFSTLSRGLFKLTALCFSDSSLSRLFEGFPKENSASFSVEKSCEI